MRILLIKNGQNQDCIDQNSDKNLKFSNNYLKEKQKSGINNICHLYRICRVDALFNLKFKQILKI